MQNEINKQVLNIFYWILYHFLIADHRFPSYLSRSFRIPVPMKSKTTFQDYFSLPRQNFKKTYAANGVIDIYKKDHIVKKKELYGEKSLAFKTPFTYEIDTIDQYKYLKLTLKK